MKPPHTDLVIGSETPDVYLDVFVDPTCSHCRDEFTILRGYVDKSARPVQVRFFHIPRDFNGCGLGRPPHGPTAKATTHNACVATFAVECIDSIERGKGIDALGEAFAMQGDKDAVMFTREKFIGVAEKLGISVDVETTNRLNDCISHREQEVAQKILSHLVYAYTREIISTPTVYVTPVIDGLPRYSLQGRYERGAKYTDTPDDAYAELDARIEIEFQRVLQRLTERGG